MENMIETGEQQSFEIGAVRTMLAHIIGRETQNDPCAVYIKPIIDQFHSYFGCSNINMTYSCRVYPDII